MVARFASYFGHAHAVFFMGKCFVVLLSTTKTTKILPPQKIPAIRYLSPAELSSERVDDVIMM